MNTLVLNKIESNYTKSRPNIEVGDVVVVNTIIRDGEKKRIQKFQGIVIGKKGKGVNQTFTVRKVSYGVGVEKIFPLNSTNIDSIEVLRHSKVRRSKLYYLRGRIGKAAMKLKAGKSVSTDADVPEEGETIDEDAIVVEENPDASDEAAVEQGNV